MEEKQQCSGGACKKCRVRSAAPFILGLVVALTFGWWVFPELLYSQKEQPLKFSHANHVDVRNLTCSDCHSFRADGSFAGLPGIEKCASCHSTAAGKSEAEAALVGKYVSKGKEIPWYVHQKQPDNVFFSHAAHNMATCVDKCHQDWEENDLCSRCHLSVTTLDKNPAYQENVLTKYSRTTMKMWECEECHAKVGHFGITKSNNACYTCHK